MMTLQSQTRRRQKSSPLGSPRHSQTSREMGGHDTESENFIDGQITGTPLERKKRTTWSLTRKTLLVNRLTMLRIVMISNSHTTKTWTNSGNTRSEFGRHTNSQYSRSTRVDKLLTELHHSRTTVIATIYV